MINSLPPATSENSLQQKSLWLLSKLGYEFISTAENKELRNNHLHEVILKNICSKQLAKMNSYVYKGQTFEFSQADIDREIYKINTISAGGLLSTNKKITETLILGTSIEQTLPNGSKKSFSFKFIDFENIENNAFHVTEEFTVERNTKTESDKTRRADIVVFINGFPIVVMELKKSDIETSKGISQLISYQSDKEIPKLFEFSQLVIAGNNHSPTYATTGSAKKFYLVWKEEGKNLISELNAHITNREPSELDKLIISLCSKSRLLEMFRFFIIFDNNVKKVARYQQYFAIKEILNKVSTYDGDTRNGGLVWHTQGSGKSLTMVMATMYLQKKISDARIIVVTDRVDLDKQISETFKNSDIEVEKAKTGKDLVEKLDAGASVITSVINKFKTVANQKCVFNSSNIFILVDESHRTQSGDLHRAMKKVFVNGCYIGFTGTPLLKSQKNDGSISKFNGLIHKYTIDEAIKDCAVLPLLYEARMVDQWITDESALDLRFKRYTDNLTEEQVKDLKRKWVNFRNVASSKQRLEAIVFDIEDHFIKNVRNLGFKAMLATNSKIEAIRYKKLFDEGNIINAAVSISEANVKEGNDEVNDTKKEVQIFWDKMLKEYGSKENYNNRIESEFTNADGEVEILIVVDKLLTGFDAPIAQVLYIDKELKSHTLLQAIARVNRICEGKDYGLIVDYRGLFENLDNALSSYNTLAGYDDEDIKSTFGDIKIELQKIKTSFSQLQDIFRSIKHKNDQESYEIFLDTQPKRNDFYQSLNVFARDLAFALGCEYVNSIYSEDELYNFKKWLRFYDVLRKSLRIRYAESIDFSQYEKRMQNLLDIYIGTNGEVSALSAIVDIFSDEFKKEVDSLSDRAKADSIVSATTKYAKENREKNPSFYDNISKKINEILEKYKEKRLSEKGLLAEAEHIYATIDKNNKSIMSNYPESINSPAKQSFYDSLECYFEHTEKNDYIEMVTFIDSVFKNYVKKPNWKNNLDVKNNIMGDIEDELYTKIVFDDLDDFLQKAYELGVNNYD